jgi:FMN phosphatase YigB (HAD superfamily)
MRHISFDFWNTIGKPNKVYARERSRLLSEVFAVSLDEAKATYSKVKKALDHAAETEGVDHGREYNIAKLCEAFGKPDADQQFRDQLQVEMDKLFAEHPPTIDDALIAELDRAHKMGITLSIGSNTNFIEGQTILDHVIGRRIPFAFSIFSDEVSCSKPNPDFFALIAHHAGLVNPLITSNRDIIHVGDNDICDCKGADAAGMRYLFTENADTTAGLLAGLLGTVE